MRAGSFRNLERFGSRVALVDEQGRTTSYGELLEHAESAAADLDGTRRLVLLELERTPTAIAAYLGLLRGGHVVLPFAREDEAKLTRLVSRFEPNAVVRAREHACQIEWLHRREHALHPDVCLLLSTSGTTGSPKLVKLSHSNLDSNAAAIAEYLALTPTERGFTTLPLHYSYGLSVLHSHFACGASLALSDCSVSETRFWPLFERLGATSFAGVPHTFELLERADPAWARTPGLRYATQAGGRLAPDLVRRCARLGAEHGWRFFVMYGQTEAAPRIAYLPPERALESADCIGIAVPGGEIVLLDDQDRPIDEPERAGELCYRGPNVMLGYAENAAELLDDETPPLLRTGDVACRSADGLFRIVGRLARFVKPFGLRVNLDEIEARVRETWPEAACSGNDERIVLALAGAPDPDRARRLVAELAQLYRLPESLFSVTHPGELPVLPNGKLDYRRILDGVQPAPAKPRRPSLVRSVLSRRMLALCIHEGARILGVARSSRASVAAIYHAVLRVPEVREQDTFVGLSGDSLSYVDASLALEEYLGHLPRGWEQMSVTQLEGCKPNDGVL